jgi:hypothetical protein
MELAVANDGEVDRRPREEGKSKPRDSDAGSKDKKTPLPRSNVGHCRVENSSYGNSGNVELPMR